MHHSKPHQQRLEKPNASNKTGDVNVSVATQGSNLPAVPEDEEDFTGLEDFSDDDFRTPRLKIGHKGPIAQKFVNTLTQETYDFLDVVILCMVKGRIKWNTEVEDDAIPQCKSVDHKIGFPTLEAKDPDNLFPWADSNYEPEDMQADAEGRAHLTCSGCQFKEWQRKGTKNKPPPCNEQHNYAVMLVDTGETFILTLQKSGLSASTRYAASFKQRKVGLFTKITRISLKGESRAGNEYSVPVFASLDDSDPMAHGDYATQGRSLRQYLLMPPRVDGDEDTQPANVQAAQPNTGPPPAAAATPAPAPAQTVQRPAAVQRPARPAPAAAPPKPAVVESTVVEEEDDSKLPF